jgi:hypothetical protein
MMSKKKEKKLKLQNNPKWIIAGMLVFIVIISVILSPSARTLSIKTLLMPNRSDETKTKRISVTVYPLNEFSKEDYIKMAISDLSKTESLDKALISVESADVTEWSDTGLGCPKEGMMYAQVITPGYKIKLRAIGKEYFYHAGLKRVVFCPDN